MGDRMGYFGGPQFPVQEKQNLAPSPSTSPYHTSPPPPPLPPRTTSSTVVPATGQQYENVPIPPAYSDLNKSQGISSDTSHQYGVPLHPAHQEWQQRPSDIAYKTSASHDLNASIQTLSIQSTSPIRNGPPTSPPYFPPPPQGQSSSPRVSPSYFPPPPTYSPQSNLATPQPSSQTGLSRSYSPAFPPRSPSALSPAESPLEDHHKSSTSKRFIGNTLAGRVVRASYKSLTTTVGLPLYLSPWGDNNPVTLPNIRRRDAALAFVGHFGAEALAPAALEVTGEVIRFSAQQSAEQVADESLTKIFGGKAGKVTLTGNVRTIEVRVKHKLMGVDAVIQLSGERTSESMLGIEKGWFCPYLFASGRTPQIPRSKDFAVAELITPGLKADPELARTLLTAISQDPLADILSLCPWNPTIDIQLTRLLITFVGINPWRTQAWSQSRIPGEARLMFHLLVGCPALVIPIGPAAPVCGWSPWTMGQMQSAGGSGGYSVERHVEEIYQYLETIFNLDALEQGVRGNARALVLAGLRSMVQSVVDAKMSLEKEGGGGEIIDEERAGIVMFRY